MTILPAPARFIILSVFATLSVGSLTLTAYISPESFLESGNAISNEVLAQSNTNSDRVFYRNGEQVDISPETESTVDEPVEADTGSGVMTNTASGTVVDTGTGATSSGYALEDVVDQSGSTLDTASGDTVVSDTASGMTANEVSEPKPTPNPNPTPDSEPTPENITDLNTKPTVDLWAKYQWYLYGAGAILLLIIVMLLWLRRGKKAKSIKEAYRAAQKAGDDIQFHNIDPPGSHRLEEAVESMKEDNSL